MFHPRYQYRIVTGFDHPTFRETLEQLTGDDYPVEHYLKNQPSSSVWCFNYHKQQLVIKRYNTRGVLHAIKRVFQRSRALNSWRMTQDFSRAGIRVADNVAIIQERWGPVKLRAWYICHYLPGDMLRDLFGSKPVLKSGDPPDNELITREIRQLFSRMRENRLSHGDLKASNILLSDRHVYLIDLDSARTHRSGKNFERAHARDLARFKKNWRHSAYARTVFKAVTDQINRAPEEQAQP